LEEVEREKGKRKGRGLWRNRLEEPKRARDSRSLIEALTRIIAY